jgi:Cdc6-like AAA superfamily ATPase
MSSNQFYTNGNVPPEKFVGRTSELYTIFDQINNRGHAAIYGSSGMGKSSLLKYIQSSNFWEEKGLKFSDALIVYHNCEVSPTPKTFWQELLKELRNKAEGDTDLQEKIDGVLEKEEIGIRDIRQILKHIGEKDKFLLLLLDDYHGILSTPESYSKDHEKSQEMQTFLSGLRNLAVHSTEGQYFSTVVAAFQKLNELGPEVPRGGSPWYNHYVYVDLKPFTQKDIDNYFFNPNSHFFISIPDNFSKKEVLEITGRHPRLLQYAGSIFSEPDPNIDINIFKEKFKNRTEQIYESIWRELTTDEQRLLRLIVIDNLDGEVSGKRYSLDDIDKNFEENKSKLRTLQQKGVIYKKQEQKRDKYNFSSSLMQDLVRQKFEKSLSDPEEREIVFELERFRAKITQKEVNMLEKTSRLFFKALKALSEINPFNKSE